MTEKISMGHKFRLSFRCELLLSMSAWKRQGAGGTTSPEGLCPTPGDSPKAQDPPSVPGALRPWHRDAAAGLVSNSPQPCQATASALPQGVSWCLGLQLPRGLLAAGSWLEGRDGAWLQGPVPMDRHGQLPMTQEAARTHNALTEHASPSWL